MSSSIAAVVRTVPRRVVVKPLVLSTVNVVPRLVEHSAAPAANACSGVDAVSLRSVKDNAMGKQMPVAATAMDIYILAFTAAKEVEMPPVEV